MIAGGANSQKMGWNSINADFNSETGWLHHLIYKDAHTDPLKQNE
jgi:hypothetical protein